MSITLGANMEPSKESPIVGMARRINEGLDGQLVILNKLRERLSPIMISIEETPRDKCINESSGPISQLEQAFEEALARIRSSETLLRDIIERLRI